MTEKEKKPQSIDDILAAVINEAVTESAAEDGPAVPQSPYKVEPVSMLEFACSSKFLGLEDDLFPMIKEIIKYIDRPFMREIYLLLGKGSGKSTLVEINSLYGVYIWDCLRDPFTYFNLMHTAKPACVNVSCSREQAKDVVFEGCVQLSERSPYFKGRGNALSNHIEFDCGMTLYAGHSNAAAWLGYTTFVGSMDEVEFMVDSQSRSQASQLYTALRGSLKTRFPKHYKLLCISSANQRTSFLMKKAQLVLKAGTQIAELHCPDKPPTNFEEYNDAQSRIDMASFNSILTFCRGLNIQAAETSSQMAVIAPTWLISTNQDLESFAPDFKDPDLRATALRDFASVPVYSISPFFKNPMLLYSNAVVGKKCPIEDDISISDVVELRPMPGVYYYFAADYSINTDAMGLSLVCRYPYSPDTFELVFSKQVKVSKGSEADYGAVENLIRMLRDRGFRINKIGFDQYQSHSSKMNLIAEGFDVEIVSYKDSLACNRTLKELIVTSRFRYGECDTVFIGEASELQVVNDKRIDHLASGGVYNSKDVWDSSVNALVLCMEAVEPLDTEYE